MRAAFGVEISVRDVFARPALEALAAEIERRVYAEVLAMPDDQAAEMAGLQPAAGGVS